MSLEYLKILSLGGGYLDAGDHGSRARHGGFPERETWARLIAFFRLQLLIIILFNAPEFQ
jgi:hypothetical protein